MRSIWLWVLCVLAFLVPSLAQGDEPAGANAQPPFWLAPRISPTTSPTDVTLFAAPDDRIRFALVQVANVDPSTFAVSNPLATPFVKQVDSGYAVLSGGLKEGAQVYGDRTYQVRKLPPALVGLPLLRTKAAHKAVMDPRFAIVVSSPKLCYVLVAIDQRAIDTYKQVGIPGWLQEFAPTEHRIETDDPIMAQASAVYQVFAKKAAAGRIALGAPCMDVSHNSMYFAFFAEAK